MRLTNRFVLVSFLMGTAACASSASNGPATEAGKQQPGSSTNGTDPNAPPPEKPLTARPVCDTVATDRYLGDGCSGSAGGQEVCAFPSSYCGANECVFDTRKSGSFGFYCAPHCDAADASLACPLGYECVTPDPSCAGNAADGVCTRRTDFACTDAGDASGTFIEGLDGALLIVKWTGTQGTLRQRTSSGGFRTLASWTESSSSSYGSVYGVARTDSKLLVVTSSNEILVEDGTAKVTKRAVDASSSYYYRSVGVTADGSFVSLDAASDSYATLSRRGGDGKWTEVGPTRKRLSTIAALEKGFIARCGEDLCTSVDGENFDAVALPSDVAFGEASRFTAAGASPEDFYLALDGRLFHHRKGKWVEEGPHGTPPSSTSSSQPDLLRVSSTGAVAFFTYDYATYTYTSYARRDADECWKTTTADNLNSATLVADSLVWATSSAGDLCTLAVR